MHEDARLARPGPREDEDIRLFPVVGDKPPLHRVVEALDDGAPRVRRGLPGEVLAVGEPPLEERIARQREVVHREPDRLRDGLQAARDELRHDVDLQRLLLVVEFEWCEVGLAEAPSRGFEANRHGRPGIPPGLCSSG